MNEEKQKTTDQTLLDKKKESRAQRELFTNREAADFLRISEVTLWRERKKGKIAFRRVSSKIVYLREDLEVYLAQNKREAFSV